MSTSSSENREYIQLLQEVVHDIDTLILQIETTTNNPSGDKMSTDIIFDAIPIIRRLKEAKRYAEQSCHIYLKKK